MDKMAKFPINTRVRLRDVSPEFYDGYGCVGNEGWITAQKTDEYGYSHVYIVWDKEHWAYNGAPDKWTWEDHFDKVDDNMADEPKKQDMKQVMADAFMEVFQNIVNKRNASESKPDEMIAEKVPYNMDDDDERKSAIIDAADILNSSESFIIIGVERTPAPNTANGMLDVRVARQWGGEDSGHMMNLQMATFGLAAYENMAVDLIQKEYHKNDM